MSWDTRRLFPKHGWRTQPGHKTIVLGRGMVRFDYPASWIVTPGSMSVVLEDPARTNRLETTYVSMTAFGQEPFPPVADVLDHMTSSIFADRVQYGALREEIRRGIEIAWRQSPLKTRDASERTLRGCIARRATVDCILIHAYPSEDPEAAAVWETVLDTLVLDTLIRDPRRGPDE